MNLTAKSDRRGPEDIPSWNRIVLQKVQGLQYGTIQLTVHEGRVTQVESTEKIRIQPASASYASD